MNLIDKTIRTIKKYSMLSESDSLLIGLSGGPDSVCLTIILDKLRNNFNLSLSAIYVNHGLRPDESMGEDAFCRALCDKHGIRFYTKSVNVKEYATEKKISIQEAARELRYKVFKVVSEDIKAEKIALAHNADDQAETVLMHLIRGAGRRGLSGIPAVRGNIIRPLIEIQRSEIENFLAQQEPPVGFITDSSNLKTEYSRNWLRLEVMPELKKQNPAVIETINRTSEILRDEDAYLETLVTSAMTEIISRKDRDSIELLIAPLENLEMPILRRVLIRALSEIVHFRGIDFIHIEDIIRLIRENKSGDMLTLPNNVRAIKRYSTLLLTKEVFSGLNTYILKTPGESFIEEIGVSIMSDISENIEGIVDGKDTAVFDYNMLSFPLSVRGRMEGDYFYPAGFGKRKKLHDFFVDAKVPKDVRDKVPVVISGEDIIWIAGHRADERFMPKGETKRFLILKIIRAGT